MPGISSESQTWLVIGVCSICALYTTYIQLQDFKRRCAVKPSDTKNVGVEQTTEDAIKLETLEALATGVNPELRTAAYKIITERAMRPTSMNHMLKKVEGEDQEERLKALKALNVLVNHAPIRRFNEVPRFFKALIGALRKDESIQNKDHVRKKCERETVSILSRFISHTEAQRHIIDAGIIDWLKNYHVDGYNNIIIAAFDPERPLGAMEPNFYDLLTAICHEGTQFRSRILDSGMVRDIRRSRSMDNPGEVWVEVEVDGPNPALQESAHRLRTESAGPSS